MHRPATVAAVVVSLFAAALATAAQPAAAPAPAPAKPPNAVQLEMQGLHELMVVSLVAIENDKLEVIPPQIHKVHGLKGETEKAIHSGAWKPARGAVADFVKEDEAFHGLLVQLLRSSKANDVVGTTKAMSAVIEGCTACHVKYRFPAKAAAK